MKHFGQTHGTPLTAISFRTSLGYKGDGPAAELILSGNSTNLELDECTTDKIKYLQRKAINNLPKTEITKARFIDTLKN